MVMLRVFSLLVLGVSLGCGDSGGTRADGAALDVDALPDTADVAPDLAPDATPDVAPDAISDITADIADIADIADTTSDTADTAAGPAHVAFVDALDLHYFRVRDPGYDTGFTEERWIGTLNLMRAAGMNLVSTYAPWDYHQPGPDTWDFSGARDLGKFMDLACARGFHVILKPGPLITGEWPKGFGSFGAVPAWWKTAHPESLALKADGTPFNYSPSGDETQTQPSYLDPTYLASVREWYRRVLAIARPPSRQRTTRRSARRQRRR